MYLYDLQVSAALRHQGVGGALMDKAKEVYTGSDQEGKADILFRPHE